MQQAAGGQEFGIEQGCAGGASHQIVREQRQLYVEQRAFANAADYGGHAGAGIYVAAWLRAILLFQHDNGIAQGRGQRG